MQILSGLFIMLHGLVHFWYVTLSQGWVRYQPAMGWTGESWLLGSRAGGGVTRPLASVLFTVSAVIFLAAGMGRWLDFDPSRLWLLAASLLSSFTLIVFWDGGVSQLVEKGLLGLLINLVLFLWIW